MESSDTRRHCDSRRRRASTKDTSSKDWMYAEFPPFQSTGNFSTRGWYEFGERLRDRLNNRNLTFPLSGPNRPTRLSTIQNRPRSFNMSHRESTLISTPLHITPQRCLSDQINIRRHRAISRIESNDVRRLHLGQDIGRRENFGRRENLGRRDADFSHNEIKDTLYDYRKRSPYKTETYISSPIHVHPDINASKEFGPSDADRAYKTESPQRIESYDLPEHNVSFSDTSITQLFNMKSNSPLPKGHGVPATRIHDGPQVTAQTIHNITINNYFGDKVVTEKAQIPAVQKPVHKPIPSLVSNTGFYHCPDSLFRPISPLDHHTLSLPTAHARVSRVCRSPAVPNPCKSSQVSSPSRPSPVPKINLSLLSVLSDEDFSSADISRIDLSTSWSSTSSRFDIDDDTTRRVDLLSDRISPGEKLKLDIDLTPKLQEDTQPSSIQDGSLVTETENTSPDAEIVADVIQAQVYLEEPSEVSEVIEKREEAEVQTAEANVEKTHAVTAEVNESEADEAEVLETDDDTAEVVETKALTAEVVKTQIVESKEEKVEHEIYESEDSWSDITDSEDGYECSGSDDDDNDDDEDGDNDDEEDGENGNKVLDYKQKIEEKVIAVDDISKTDTAESSAVAKPVLSSTSIIDISVLFDAYEAQAEALGIQKNRNTLKPVMKEATAQLSSKPPLPPAEIAKVATHHTVNCKIDNSKPIPEISNSKSQTLPESPKPQVPTQTPECPKPKVPTKTEPESPKPKVPTQTPPESPKPKVPTNTEFRANLFQASSVKDNIEADNVSYESDFSYLRYSVHSDGSKWKRFKRRVMRMFSCGSSKNYDYDSDDDWSSFESA